jgi:hypothetical protein
VATATTVPEVVPASTIGQLAGAARLAAVVVARPVDDPGPLERIGPAGAIGPLTAHLPVMGDGRAVFHRLTDVVSAVPCWTMSFTDPAVVEALADVMADVP